MKAIIDGLRYDTETAAQIAYRTNGFNCGDFHSREWTVYRTTNGRWFVHHEGGPASSMSRACSGGTTGSERIEVLTSEEAREYLARYHPEVAEEVFPDHFKDA